MGKNIYIGVLLAAVLAGCASAKKSFEDGNYDQAIELSVKKLRKDPDDEKTRKIFYEAYSIAMELDKSELKELITTNSESGYEKIYLLYERMNNRQNLAKQAPSPSSPAQEARYELAFEEYSDEMAEYKAKAWKYLTETGNALLSLGDRFNARIAYDYFIRAQRYEVTSDLKQWTATAAENGLTRVNVSFSTAPGLLVPDYTVQQMNAWNTANLSQGWIYFNPVNVSAENAHYVVNTQLNRIVMGTERVREQIYTDKKTVEDGFVYKYDEKGNKILGANGKPLTETVYKEVYAEIVRIELSKDCYIYGTTTLTRLSDGAVLRSNEVYGSSQFYHAYGLMKGDERALSSDSKTLLKYTTPLPFPSQDQMVIQATTPFFNAIVSDVGQARGQME